MMAIAIVPKIAYIVKSETVFAIPSAITKHADWMAGIVIALQDVNSQCLVMVSVIHSA